MNYKESINGICSSMLSTTFCYPLDTFKVQLQAQQKIQFNWKSAYRGLKPELISCIPSSYIFWSTYAYSREKNNSIFVSSMLAACTSNFIDTPFDVIKKQRQLQQRDSYRFNVLAKFSVANMGYSCLYNSVYMPLLNYLTQEKQWNRSVSIFSCCSLASFITYPIDRYRTQIVSQTKLAPFMKGLGLRLLFGNIYSGLYMHIFLWLNQGKF